MDNGNDMIETYLPIYIVLGLGMMTMATLLNMVFYPTIGSTYFVKTQTYVALFGPHHFISSP